MRAGSALSPAEHRSDLFGFLLLLLLLSAVQLQCSGSCHENVPAPVSSNLQAIDGLTVLAWIEIVAILVHYQPAYNTLHTMKPSEPLLLPNVTLRCGIYPAGKVDIS